MPGRGRKPKQSLAKQAQFAAVQAARAAVAKAAAVASEVQVAPVPFSTGRTVETRALETGSSARPASLAALQLVHEIAAREPPPDTLPSLKRRRSDRDRTRERSLFVHNHLRSVSFSASTSFLEGVIRKALAGDARHQCFAGWLVEKLDATEAVAWWRQAADAGEYCSQFNLGICYEKGIGLRVDPREALVCFRLAASNTSAIPRTGIHRREQARSKLRSAQSGSLF